MSVDTLDIIVYFIVLCVFWLQTLLQNIKMFNKSDEMNHKGNRNQLFRNCFKMGRFYRCIHNSHLILFID